LGVDDVGKLLDEVLVCPVARAKAFFADFFQYDVSINDMIEPDAELGLAGVFLDVLVAVIGSALS
jgi:hypothetical protein